MEAAIRLKYLMLGTLTHVPKLHGILRRGTGGTNSARYCYAVWMRHIDFAYRAGLNPYPRTVAELGPGDSLGIGLCALISGSESYIALDAVRHAVSRRNIAIFDEICELFRNRAPIPDDPEIKPVPLNSSFPHEIYPR